MKIEPGLFDTSDPRSEAEADARAEEDVRAGRLVGHSAVKRWLGSWAGDKKLPRPRAGD
ncbi:MAG: hypothetical protein ACK4K7_14530 [Allosphingosinicella sp.]|uniref:antitoxin n=1 Tax=Allosphingosinicella sp. TaxID=2823234 RepID=UPI00394718FA